MASDVTKVTGAPWDREFIIEASTSTPENDLGTMGAATLHKIKVDARNNPGERVYCRVYDAAAPTVGTTASSEVFPCNAGQWTEYSFPEGSVYGTGISVATVTNAGTTSGANNPTGTVTITIAAEAGGT